MKPDHILDILERVADTADHERYFLAAAIVIKNRIISFGTNRMKTDPFQAKYGKNKDCIYMHAEIHAIKNALRHIKVDGLRKADLYVLRVRNGDGARGLSKPCEGCQRAIAEFGIRNVIYTTDDGGTATL